MKKPMTRSVGRLESIHTADQKLSIPVLLSFVGHVVFCVLFIVLPKVSFDNKMPTRVINVQLVPMPASISVPEQKLPASEAAPVVQPEASTPKADVSTASKPKEAVSLAPKEPEKKQSMKKRTDKRDSLRESALKRVEERVEESKSDPKQQALDRIRERLREKEVQATDGQSTAETGNLDLSGQGKAVSDKEIIYIAKLRVKIQANWAFSEELAGGEKNLYNEVVIKIMRNGVVDDIWFDRRSGNKVFDDLTYKAIQKSSPLPPIPEEISGPSMTLVIRFKPEGIK